MKTENTEMKELDLKEVDLKELDQANGGWWFLGILAAGAVIGVIHGALSD